MTADSALATCVNSLISERLANFCLLSTLANGTMSDYDKKTLNTGLSNEGYTTIENRYDDQKLQRGFARFVITPSLNFSDNVNGGNSNQPIKVGELEFIGDEKFFKKSDVLVGLSVTMFGRRILGRGRYIDAVAMGGISKSPQHNLNVTTGQINICSKNHLTDLWFLDACLEKFIENKSLRNHRELRQKVSVSKLLSHEKSGFSELSIGMGHLGNSEYKQEQILLGAKTIHPSGITSDLQILLGEKVPGKLVTKHAFRTSISFEFYSNPVTMNFNLSQAVGGRLFGVARDEKSRSIVIEYPITDNVVASFGFKETDSNIDYFDFTQPIAGMRFNLSEF